VAEHTDVALFTQTTLFLDKPQQQHFL